jgi:iron complex transport system substrate-binding protein
MGAQTYTCPAMVNRSSSDCCSVSIRRVMCAWIAAVACSAAHAGVPISVTDDRGAAITLAQPAARMITLSPHLTELVYAAGAGDRLIAVPKYSDYPDAAKSLPEIGDATRVDLERVLALRPDLILAWKSGNSAADIARLESLGLRVYVSDAGRLADVARVVRTIGRLAGTAAAAERQASDYDRRIAALRARYAGARQLRVFYQIWDRPLLTINGRHIISDVLGLCGAVNVFEHAALLTPSVSLEALFAAHPDVVLGGSSALAPAEFAAQWASYRVHDLARLSVKYVPPDLIQRATPRIAQGAAVVCERLQEVRSSLQRR